MRTQRIRLIEILLLGFVVLSVLWRGGKSLDATLALSLLASAATLVTIVRRGTDESQNGMGKVPRALIWSAGLLTLWTIMSFLLSKTRNYGFDEVLQSVSLFLLLRVSMEEARRDPQFPSRFARTIGTTALIACGIGILVYCLQPVNRAVGAFFDWRFSTDYWPNAWAEFLLLAWPLTLWNLTRKLSQPSTMKTVASTGVLSLLLALLFLSFSRGGIITLALQLVIFAGMLLWKYERTFPWKRILAQGGCVIGVAVILFLGINQIRGNVHPVESVVRKATLTSDEGSSSVTERTQFWKQAMVLTKEHPIFGWGPYSFRFVQPRLQTAVLATSDHPHNVFLKLAMERGIPAALLMLAMIVLALSGGLRTINAEGSTLKDAESTNLYQLLVICMIVSVIGVLFHNLIDYNLQFVGIVLPLWMMIGFLGGSEKSPVKRSNLPVKIVTGATAAILLVATVICSWQLMQFSLARRAMMDGRTVEALRIFGTIHTPLFPRDDILTQASLEISIGKNDAASRSLERYQAENQEDARFWEILGELTQKDGDPDLSPFQNAFELGRWNDVSIARSIMLLIQHNPALRDELRKNMDETAQNFATAIMRNSHFIALSSNVENLSSLLDLLAKNYPSDGSKYRTMKQEIESKAQEIRAQSASRPRGWLW